MPATLSQTTQTRELSNSRLKELCQQLIGKVNLVSGGNVPLWVKLHRIIKGALVLISSVPQMAAAAAVVEDEDGIALNLGNGEVYFYQREPKRGGQRNQAHHAASISPNSPWPRLPAVRSETP